MSLRTSSALDDRYGRRGAGRRRWAWVVGLGVAAAVAIAALVWIALYYASPPVSSRLLGWRVVDGSAVNARVEVAVDAATPASCELLARAADHAVVGRRTVQLPAGDERRVVLEERIATERLAVVAELVGCRAPGMTRPR